MRGLLTLVRGQKYFFVLPLPPDKLNYSAGSAGGESNMSMAVDEEENEMEITRVTGTRGGRKSSKSGSNRGRNKNKQQPIVTITER